MSPTRRKWLKITALFFLSVILIIGVAGYSFFNSVKNGKYGQLPDITRLQGIEHHEASEIFSKDSLLLGRIFEENRTNITFEQIPQHFIDALVATEDIRFYEHEGIDYKSLKRVVWKSLLQGKRSSGGGSTITMQLAKNLFPRGEHGKLSMPINKLKECIIAHRLEELYDKKEILVLYLNTVSFGEDTYGLSVASRRFFSKSVSELTLSESATLVGLLKANTTFNPRLHPEASQERRNIVLSQMVKYGYLADNTFDTLRNKPIILHYQKAHVFERVAPYFSEYVIDEAQRILEDSSNTGGVRYNLFTDGLKVYTTLNPALQTMAEKAVAKRMIRNQRVLNDEIFENKRKWKSALDSIVMENPWFAKINKGDKDYKKTLDSLKRIELTFETFDNLYGERDTTMSVYDSIIHQHTQLQTSFVAIDPASLEVLAYVGGIYHKHYPYDHVQAKRQTGSVFKPIVYANALNQGISPCRLFSDTLIEFPSKETGDKPWAPRNVNREYKGYYTMAGGLARSVNTVTAQLTIRSGVENTVELAKAMGISSYLPSDPSIGLGSGSVSLLEMTTAFGVFLNDGKYQKAHVIQRIEDAQGNVIYEAKPSSTPVLKKKYARQINEMLRQTVDNGTAGSLRRKFKFSAQMAGKTGTSQENRDGWYIGYTPKLLAGCWVGADDPRIHYLSTKLGQGAKTAMPIWAEFFSSLQKEKQFRKSYFGEFKRTWIPCPSYIDSLPADMEMIEAILKKNQWTISDDLREELEEEIKIIQPIPSEGEVLPAVPDYEKHFLKNPQPTKDSLIKKHPQDASTPPALDSIAPQ